MQKFKFGGGAVLALLGLVLLVFSFVFSFREMGGTLASNIPPLLLIGAAIVMRIGVLMSERYLCSACGERVTRTSTECPRCDEPLAGMSA